MTGVQTCALPICCAIRSGSTGRRSGSCSATGARSSCHAARRPAAAWPRARAARADPVARPARPRDASRRPRLEAAIDIWGERRKRISTGELNRVITAATDRTPPPPVRGHRPRLFYATQAAVAPPTFVFFASDASLIHFSYRRYLENRLRETFGFDGTPIRLVFRDRASVKLPRRKKSRSAPVKTTRRPSAARTRRSR